MSNFIEYIFSIGGNFTAKITGMNKATGEFEAQVKGARTAIGKLTGALATFDLLSNAVQNTSNAIASLSEAGISLDANMHDLSAVAGVTGDTLKR